MMDRRTFLKGLTLTSVGLVPLVVFPVKAGEIEPTPLRPLKSLGYLAINFHNKPDVLFPIDETWMCLEKTNYGVAMMLRQVEFTAADECVIVGVSLLTVGGELIRRTAMRRELYLLPCDSAHIAYRLDANFA